MKKSLLTVTIFVISLMMISCASGTSSSDDTQQESSLTATKEEDSPEKDLSETDLEETVDIADTPEALVEEHEVETLKDENVFLNKTFTTQYDVAGNINSDLKYDYEDIAWYSDDCYGISMNSVRRMIEGWYFAEVVDTDAYSDTDLMLLFETLLDAYSYMADNDYVSIDYTDIDDIRYMLAAKKASVLTEEDVDGISDGLATVLYAWLCDYERFENQTIYEAQDETDYGDEDFILPYSSSRYYTEEELSAYTKEELRLARNEIYAWHGRLFDSEDLQRYFNNKDWYNGYLTADQFDESVLNDYEKKNLIIIKSVEDSLN